MDGRGFMRRNRGKWLLVAGCWWLVAGGWGALWARSGSGAPDGAAAGGWWLVAGAPLARSGSGSGAPDGGIEIGIGIGTGAFRYSRRGLRLRRRGAYGIHRACRPLVPRVVFADAQGAKAVVGAFKLKAPVCIKPSQPGFRPSENRPTALRVKEIPPFGGWRHHLSPASGGTITRAYCRAIYEENVSRCFILPPA